MSIESAEAVVQLLGPPAVADPRHRFETYRVMGAGHAFLVDNPLGLAEVIVRALDSAAPPRQGRIDVGEAYVTLDAALGSGAHHEHPQPPKGSELPPQPGQRRG